MRQHYRCGSRPSRARASSPLNWARCPYAVYRARHAGGGGSGGDGLDREDLGWVTYFDEDATTPAIARATKRLSCRGEEVRLTSSDAGIMLSAVRAGIGKGLLPMCVAEEDPALVRLNPGAPPEFVRTLLLHPHPDTVEARRIQATIRWLRESFQAVFRPPETALPPLSPDGAPLPHRTTCAAAGLPPRRP